MKTRNDEDIVNLILCVMRLSRESDRLRTAWQDFRHDMQMLPYNNGECSAYNEADIWDLISKYDEKFKEDQNDT